MKRLSIVPACCGVLLMVVCLSTGNAFAQAGDVVVHTATVDVTHLAGTEPVDQIDMTASRSWHRCLLSGDCNQGPSVGLHARHKQRQWPAN